MLFGLFLAWHAARRLGRGMQVRCGDVGAAIGAPAIGARLDARQGGFNVREVDRFAFVQCELQCTLGSQLGARIFRLAEMVGGSLGPADGTATLLGQLGQQCRAFCEQSLVERGGLGRFHAAPEAHALR